MNCPKCQTTMVSAVRVYDGNTVKTETLYCPKCGCRRERHRTGRAALAALMALAVLSGPCIDNSAWLRIGQQPVIENPAPPHA